MTALQSPPSALPAAVYSITMDLRSPGLWIRRNHVKVETASRSGSNASIAAETR